MDYLWTICTNPNGKSKITQKQQGASQRPCFCLAFDCIIFLRQMVTVCIALVSLRGNETR
jgi:hypothetical protein